MLKLGIQTRMLLLIMAATLLPLLFLNVFWTNSQRQSLINEARSQQTLIAGGNAEQVNDFVINKIRALIIHSQSPSLQQLSPSKATLDIETLLYQDKDLTRAALVDQNGQEVIAMTSDLKNAPLKNVKNDDAFKVVNYFAGNQYISPVNTDSHGHPMVTMAIPLVTFTTPQELTSLSTSEPGLVRNPQDIKGALIVQASLESLWHTVLSNASSSANTNSGYAYVVDDKGIVVAHPDVALTNAHSDLSSTPIVSLFKTNLGNTSTTTQSLQATSEKGIEVMATYQKVPSTNWAVIFEEPMSNIYQSVDQVAYLGTGISIVAFILLGLLSVWLSRYITSPILSIARTAKLVGQGDLAARVLLRRNDEIGTLAANINAMGENLQTYISRIDTQRRQLETILNSTTDGILAIDRAGKVIIANHATGELSGYTPETLIGEDIQNIFTWTKKAKPFKLDYFAENTNTYTDLEYKDSKGGERHIDLIVVQVKDETIITIHDETKSRELDTMKIDFVSIAAHQLRTPLSKIRGLLELMEPSTDATMKKYNAQARQSAQELSSLISNLLDVSRIEQSTLALTMDKVDLVENIKRVTHDMQFSADAKHITLKYTGPEQGAYVAGDKVALHEVVNNLVDNAIKYTDQGGSVTVSLDRKGGSYIMRVKDDGIGIPVNSLPYLFTKFYRVHNGPESGNTGTGLGLFIAKSVIERHGGTIRVESHSGEGSVFIVTIPAFNETIDKTTQTLKEGEHNVGRHGWTTKNITR